MSVTIIKSVIRLQNAGWRPYSEEPAGKVYEDLKCPHANSRGKTKPFWFVRSDIFICIGCTKQCCLSRPTGFIIPLPIKYKENIESPFKLTPAEMVAYKSLLRVDEAAYCLNVSERTIYEWVAMGKLRKTKDHPVRISSEDIAFCMNNFDD